MLLMILDDQNDITIMVVPQVVAVMEREMLLLQLLAFLELRAFPLQFLYLPEEKKKKIDAVDDDALVKKRHRHHCRSHHWYSSLVQQQSCC